MLVPAEFDLSPAGILQRGAVGFLEGEGGAHVRPRRVATALAIGLRVGSAKGHVGRVVKDFHFGLEEMAGLFWRFEAVLSRKPRARSEP